MTNFQHLAEPSVSASTLQSAQQHADSATPHGDTLSMVTHTILETLHMEEKTYVVDTNHQVGLQAYPGILSINLPSQRGKFTIFSWDQFCHK